MFGRRMIVGLLIIAVFLVHLSKSDANMQKIGTSNPAAVYCEALGYKYEVVKTSKGEKGICIFPDGSGCSAWSFLAGDCGQEWGYCERHGYKTETVTGSYSEKVSACVLPNGTRSVIELMQLERKITRGFIERNEVLDQLTKLTTQPTISALPDQFDWRDKNGEDWTTPVKDQGMCGSCWAFSAIGTVESQYKIAGNNPDMVIDLSEENLVSNCSKAGDCCGGWHNLALNYIEKYGVVNETCFPYVDYLCVCDGICPVEEIAFGRGKSENTLNLLREFRDSELNSCYVNLYYKYSPEIKQILIRNPALIPEAWKLISKYEPALNYIMKGEGEDINITETDAKEVIDFLHKLENKVNNTKEEKTELLKLLKELEKQVNASAGKNFSQAFYSSPYYGQGNCQVSEDGNCRSNAICSDRCEGIVYKIDGHGHVPRDQTLIKKFLIASGPLSVAMGIGDEVGGYFDKGIYRCEKDNRVNHAVVIVGYNDSGGYWIVKNSWGIEWGDNGYFKVGYGECSIENYVYYAKIGIKPAIIALSDETTVNPGDKLWGNRIIINPTDQTLHYRCLNEIRNSTGFLQKSWEISGYLDAQDIWNKRGYIYIPVWAPIDTYTYTAILYDADTGEELDRDSVDFTVVEGLPKCGDQTHACECGIPNPMPCCDNNCNGIETDVCDGNCVWWAWEQACCKWGVGLPGTVSEWDDGRKYSETPVVDAIAVRCGKVQESGGDIRCAPGKLKHTAYVVWVSNDKAEVKVSEMNCWRPTGNEPCPGHQKYKGCSGKPCSNCETTGHSYRYHTYPSSYFSYYIYPPTYSTDVST